MPLVQFPGKIDAPPSSSLSNLLLALRLVKKSEGGQSSLPSHITSNISSCLGIVRMVPLSWEKMGNPRLPFLNVPMVLVAQHSLGDVVTKLLHLLANVAEESIAWPPPYRHDCVHWAFAQMHRHCCARSDRVRSYFTLFYTQFVTPNSYDSCFQSIHQHFWRDIF